MAIRALVCTDGSKSSRKTLDYTIRLARKLPMEMVVAHALDLGKLDYRMIADMYLEMIQQRAKETAEALLKREARVLHEAGVDVRPRLLLGPPGRAICEAAEDEDVSLVVIGRRGQSDIQDLLFGSVSSYVVHHSERPVLVVKRIGRFPTGPAADQPVRCLVGADGSEATDRCLDALVELADGSDAFHVTLLHAVNPAQPGLEHLPGEARYEALRSLHEEAEALLSTAAERLRKAGLHVDTRVEEGSAGKTLCRIYEEDEHELVVVGRRGYSALREAVIGSVSHFVMHHCPGHVLVVP